MEQRISSAAKALALLAIGVLAGYAIFAWRANHRSGEALPASASVTAPTSASAPATSGERKVLYWYDPMVPQQKFDKPGKSPFMDMELVPKYADSSASQPGVSVDPRAAQALGWRTAVVQRQRLGAAVSVPGIVQLNDREVAVVQARAAGFVESVAALAPGDVIKRGARLADILVPEWAGAQQEFLAVRASGDAALTRAARHRLQLLGMPEGLIAQVERSGKVAAIYTVVAPRDGLIEELMVRQGMTVSPGMSLVRINGLSSVWVEAALPLSQADAARVGQPVKLTIASQEGKPIEGKVTAILSQANAQSRTLRVRIEVPNPAGQWRAGMFATVTLPGLDTDVLAVPSEAVIRTGRRAIVYVTDGPGRYRPVQVEVGGVVGDGSGEFTTVLSGLEEGQQVVASGQFLLDSEASMQGLLPAMPAAGEVASTAERGGGSAPSAKLHHGEGTITEIGEDGITLDHGPIPSIKWGPMVMSFPLARPELAKGRKVGEKVSFAFTSGDDGTVLQEIKPAGPAAANKPGGKP